MLEVVNISQTISRPGAEPLNVLDHVNFSLPSAHLTAVAGAVGSGKSALLKILAGVEKAAGGTFVLQGQAINEKRGLHPNAVGYVPAGDEDLNEGLTVRESLMSALFLRVADLKKNEMVERTAHLLVITGLETVAKEHVKTLTKTQRRRLKLGLALVSEPLLVVCDDFTDGVDARSERELTALLRLVMEDVPGRVVLNATHSLSNLDAYDTVVVLYEGHVSFHGPARALPHYFTVAALEDLYPRLAKRPSERWGESWIRHRQSYYNAFKLGTVGDSLAAPVDEEDAIPSDTGKETGMEDEETDPELRKDKDKEAEADKPTINYPALPDLGTQVSHLVRRRWTLLKRNKREWRGHLLLLVGAPVLMVMMLWPNAIYLKTLMSETESALTPEVLWPAAYTCMMALLVQALLIAALAIRNGAREIAGERALFERERIAGLRPAAYLIAKWGYVGPLVLVQTFSLGLFIELATGGLPGYAFARLILLTLTGLAFTSFCLGLSAWTRHAEAACSRAWLLVFGNLLLAGALLGFPRVLGVVLQPFVTLYYGWSGSMDTLKETPMFEQATSLVRTSFASPSLAMLMLLIHLGVGVALTAYGLRRQR